MSTSSVPAVRAALFDSLPGWLGADWSVFYGFPGKDVPQRFAAVSSTVDGLSREQRTLPLRQGSSRTENYGLTVILWHLERSFTSAAIRTAVESTWVAADAIDNGLRTDPSLTGLVTSALLTDYEDTDHFLNEGYASQLVLTVTVQSVRA